MLGDNKRNISSSYLSTNKSWLNFKENLKIFFDKKLNIFSFSLVVFLIFIAIFAPVLAPYEYDIVNPSNALAPPSLEHLMGTDTTGRDIFSRVLHGTTTSLSLALTTIIFGLLTGVSVGAISGYFGGRVDQLIMWLINVTWSIPTLLLVIAITLALGKGFWQVFIAVGLTMWVEVARVVRGQVMSVKQRQFVTAARALGYSDVRIILKHILPNALTPVIIISAANFASAILIESGLSFLGIGAQPPIPSWGSIIKDHYAYIVLGKPYLALVPGFAIMILVMAFMLVGNTLRDVLDVKQ